MKKLFPYIVVTLIVFLLPSTGLAGKRGNPFYFSAAGSFVVPQDSDLESTNPATNAALQAASAQAEFSTGLGASAAMGLFIKRRLRVEFEYAYKTADIDQINLSPAGGAVTVASQGEASINSFMANAAFDFRNSSRFSPYLGAGVGFGLVDFQSPTFTTGGVTVPAVNGNEPTFVYQLFGGVGYWATPQIVGFLGYKFLGTGDPTIQTITSAIDTHNFEVGVRYYFSRP